MTSQPNFVYVAPLRNHPHEKKFTEYEPIKTSFQELERRQHKAVRTRSDYKPFMDKLSEQVLQRDDLVRPTSLLCESKIMESICCFHHLLCR